ncbi:MAG: HEAT repeat domain-containing protein [Xenococcaceae cyanobacterium MO_188.B19]|nr:HEAT repeat domain-containing protein [Xenococcaceae cyanobacterium MO_188.B19]
MNKTELNTLKTALKSEDREVRREAIPKLGLSIHNKQKTLAKDPSYEKVIPILTAALSDRDGYVAVSAAEALVALDRKFERVCPVTIVKTLIEITVTGDDELVDENDHSMDTGGLTVGECANYLLWDISDLVTNIAPEVIPLFADSDDRVHRRAVRCALSYAVTSDNATLFTQALTDKNKLVRLGVLEFFLEQSEYGDLYDEEYWIIPAVEKALEDKNREVRSAAKRALRALK